MYGHRKERICCGEVIFWSWSITAYNTKMDRIDGSGSVKAVLRNRESSSPSVWSYREGVFGFCENRYCIRSGVSI